MNGQWKEGRQKPWLVANQVNILQKVLLTLTMSLYLQCSHIIIPNSCTIIHYLKCIPYFHIHENTMRKLLDVQDSIKAEHKFSACT